MGSSNNSATLVSSTFPSNVGNGVNVIATMVGVVEIDAGVTNSETRIDVVGTGVKTGVVSTISVTVVVDNEFVDDVG
jgi:hypothetical protein